MIRKVILVLLSLGSVGLLLLWLACRFGPGEGYPVSIRGARTVCAIWGFDDRVRFSLHQVVDQPTQYSAIRDFAGISYRAGFLYQSFIDVETGCAVNREVRYTIIWLPYRYPITLLAPYPILVLIRSRLKKRRQRKFEIAGCCQHCGYNLTGLPEPRCPECGREFECEETAGRAHGA